MCEFGSQPCLISLVINIDNCDPAFNKSGKGITKKHNYSDHPSLIVFKHISVLDLYEF